MSPTDPGCRTKNPCLVHISPGSISLFALGAGVLAFGGAPEYRAASVSDMQKSHILCEVGQEIQAYCSVQLLVERTCLSQPRAALSSWRCGQVSQQLNTGVMRNTKRSFLDRELRRQEWDMRGPGLILGAYGIPWLIIAFNLSDSERISIGFRTLHYAVHGLAIAASCLMVLVFVSGRRIPGIMRQTVAILGGCSVLFLCVFAVMAVGLRIRPGFTDTAIAGAVPAAAITALMVRYVKKLSVFYRQQY